MNTNNGQRNAGALARSEGVNIGWVLSTEQFPAPKLVQFAQAAERAGFDAVWASDHFQPWQDNEGNAGQSWVILSAVGANTRRIKFGTGVTCPSYRYNPAVVAQAFATLGLLYPGRVFLGIGSGEALNEQAATGQWDEHDERDARMVEAVQLIRKLWQGDLVNHQGQHYTVNAKLYVNPPVPVPIYIAANGPKSFPTAGRYGDGLITDGESAIKGESRQAFESGLREAGKDPAAAPVVSEVFVHLGDEQDAKTVIDYWRFLPNAWSKYVDNPDPRDIERLAKQEVSDEEILKKWKVGADAKTHIQALQELIDGGVSTIFVHSAQADQERVIEFYGREVLPKLKRK